MKKLLALLGATALMTGSVFGQADIIIKQRAKEISNQNNVNQGVAPPISPGQAGAVPSGPPPPALTPALTMVQNTLAAIHPGSSLTADQKQKLSANLMAGSQGAKPSLVTINQFVEKLSAAFADKPLSATSLNRFVLELDAILNPGKYPLAKPEGIFNDIQAIFQANGMGRPKAVAIVDDVKSMSADVQRGGASPPVRK